MGIIAEEQNKSLLRRIINWHVNGTVAWNLYIALIVDSRDNLALIFEFCKIHKCLVHICAGQFYL
jgi:hypothetical protein